MLTAEHYHATSMVKANAEVYEMVRRWGGYSAIGCSAWMPRNPAAEQGGGGGVTTSNSIFNFKHQDTF